MFFPCAHNCQLCMSFLFIQTSLSMVFIILSHPVDEKALMNCITFNLLQYVPEHLEAEKTKYIVKCESV